MNQANLSTAEIDLADIRARLTSGAGPEFWRSLDELADTPAFDEMLHREFPENASEWSDPVGRRTFLKLMAASFSMAGLAGCGKAPAEKIVPYVHPPEQVVAGKPLFYATAMPRAGVGMPLLVESHMGRPTKVEGNPEHPASRVESGLAARPVLGATDLFAQASILTLYDPDRSRTVLNAGQISTWAEFVLALGKQLESQRGRQPRGAGLRLLTPPVTSPTLASLIRRLLSEYPGAKWHQFEPSGSGNSLTGIQRFTGRPLQALYRFDRADVVVALDADFLSAGATAVRYANDFSRRRKIYDGEKRNRLYVAESMPSNTGMAADHRLRLRPEQVEALTRALVHGVSGSLGAPAELGEVAQRWIAAVLQDLRAHAGRSIVVAGESQPPIVHAFAHMMNSLLGNTKPDGPVYYTECPQAEPTDGTASLGELVADMGSGAVEVLIMAGCNPVYHAPADFMFLDRLSRVKFRVHLGLYNDETALHCHWHVPAAHYLESWGDIRAFDGTASLIQPLIAPLYAGKTEIELLAALLGLSERSGYDLLREYWRERGLGPDFELGWQTALHDGFIRQSGFSPIEVGTVLSGLDLGASTQPAAQGLSLCFKTDPAIGDGDFANNGWLQELPKPFTKLTWDNAAMLSPATAERLGLQNEMRVELSCKARKIVAPVWILPGHADDCITVHLGFGRARAGQVGNGVGFNAYALRTSTEPWFSTSLSVTKLDGRHRLACTQMHHNLEGRPLTPSATLEAYEHDAAFAQKAAPAPKAHETLFPLPVYKDNAWGMAIDLNSCVGCNACVVACQAENNIPVVGKDQVLVSREMHWLRIDRYFSGSIDEPETHVQPMLCQHCEYAPCEVVCPVAATVHSSEGLNDMVYNRCVGTRYCSNNCPYKVRRFNFLQYSDFETPVLKLLRNPNVTVRSRGVMEKCTYCVQRINAARIEAHKENRPIADGEIVTACQGVCPTQAIVFGNINDPNSRVARLKQNPLNYGVLEEQNTRPRTTYLGKVTNPHPELSKPGGSNQHKGEHA